MSTRWVVISLAVLLASACSSGQGVGGAGSASAPSTVSVRGHLLFTRTTGNDVQAIYLRAGRSERRLTDPGAYCCVVRVPPDRRRILVMPGGDIAPPVTGGTINLKGSQFARLKLTDPTLNLVPQAWSPDGKRIAFEGWDDSDRKRTGIYTARVSDGGGLVRVTTRPGDSHDVPLDFSPDGQSLVFYRSVGVDPDPVVGGSLWMVSVDGSGAHQIASSSAAHPAPWARWSKDGRRILFGNERTSPSGALWTVEPDGSNLKKLFVDAKGRFPITPVWSPDDSQILFALDPTNDYFTHPANGLYVVNKDGTNLQLVNGSNDFKRDPEWW